jgi:hypothetical protein
MATTYKAIITNNDGSTRIERMNYDKVAPFFHLWKVVHESIIEKIENFIISDYRSLCVNDVRSVLFINEQTKQEFLSLVA